MLYHVAMYRSVVLNEKEPNWLVGEIDKPYVDDRISRFILTADNVTPKTLDIWEQWARGILKKDPNVVKVGSVTVVSWQPFDSEDLKEADGHGQQVTTKGT